LKLYTLYSEHPSCDVTRIEYAKNMKGRVEQMNRSKKRILILVVLASFTVALPLTSAFANPQTTPPNPTVQQPSPAPQLRPNNYPNGFYCCGFGPWYDQVNPNYQQNSWYMGPVW